MSYELFEKFLCWNLIINTGLYTLWCLILLPGRKFIFKIHHSFIPLSEDNFNKAIYQLLAIYKILIIVFCFAPWAALQLM